MGSWHDNGDGRVYQGHRNRQHNRVYNYGAIQLSKSLNILKTIVKKDWIKHIEWDFWLVRRGLEINPAFLPLLIQFNFICIALNHHYSLKGLNRPNIYDTWCMCV